MPDINGDFEERVDAELARTAKIPDDVRRLVIAARRAFDLGYSDEEFHELDRALEAFSERVPYENED